MTRYAACLLMLAASACADGRATDGWCLANAPIRPTPAETASLGDRTVEALLRHNAYGEERCGWKP